ADRECGHRELSHVSPQSEYGRIAPEHPCSQGPVRRSATKSRRCRGKNASLARATECAESGTVCRRARDTVRRLRRIKTATRGNEALHSDSQHETPFRNQVDVAAPIGARRNHRSRPTRPAPGATEQTP